MSTASAMSLNLPIIVIAGGQSQRLQLENYQRKWQLPFGQTTLLQHMLDLASQLSQEVLINSSGADTALLSDYPYPVINDEISQGPLSGLLCALGWGTKKGHKYIVTLPCDTPFISKQWIIHLYEQLQTSQSEALISRHKEDIHPLCGIWSTHLAADLRVFMNTNKKKAVYRWAKEHAEPMDYTPVNKDGDFSIDPFMNINTLEEYERALSLNAKKLAAKSK